MREKWSLVEYKTSKPTTISEIPNMQFKALCLYLTALLTLFIASSVQAGPVALAHGDLVATSGGYIDDWGIPEGRQEKGLEEAGAEGNKGWEKVRASAPE
ncbi:hypothetical protein JVT61DRAFT_8621 [Boletus reticuloceps]|uniref:Uncharacterized protein n=1 Tax=Boletus reticuloceps TaxID=495285 RepID=A0A8I2YXU9_9AGAM|nr:hypothetical protein JVT61DRAFT_8621 [Boletus reticuloceps]